MCGRTTCASQRAKGMAETARRRGFTCSGRAHSGRHGWPEGIRFGDRVRRSHRVDIRMDRMGKLVNRFDQSARRPGSSANCASRHAVRREQSLRRLAYSCSIRGLRFRRSKVDARAANRRVFAASRIALARCRASRAGAARPRPCDVDLAARIPLHLARLDLLDARLPRGRARQRAHPLARARRPGPRMPFRILYGLRTARPRRFSSTIIRLVIGVSLGRAAGGLVRRRARCALSCASRSSALVPLDP